MGFLAPAIPWAIKGASIAGGIFAGKKAQQSAMKRSPEEQAALSGAQNAAGTLATQGTNLLNQGTPLMNQAGNYWSTLLNGNRAQMAQATAAPKASITDTYRGAATGLERSGVRGAQRDLATSELARDQASKIAGLTTGIQPMAAQQVQGIGSDFLHAGQGLTQTGGQIWSNLLGQGTANRVYGRSEGQNFGSSMGGLLFDILNGSFGKMGGGGGKVPVSTVKPQTNIFQPRTYGTLNPPFTY